MNRCCLCVVILGFGLCGTASAGEPAAQPEAVSFSTKAHGDRTGQRALIEHAAEQLAAAGLHAEAETVLACVGRLQIQLLEQKLARLEQLRQEIAALQRPFGPLPQARQDATK